MLATITAKALHDLTFPGVLRLLFLCLIAYAVGWTLLGWLISILLTAYIGVNGAEGFFAHILGGAGGMIIAWFLFPLLYPVLVGFFDDYMAEVIEREDYPQLAPASPPFWPTFFHDAVFSLKAIGLNILCLPLFLIPLLGMLLYFGLNGYLLGSQFFRMAAGRRVPKEEVLHMQRHAKRFIFLGGVMISVCSTIPILNLVAPLLGVALMLHLFHALKGTSRQEIMPPA